MTVTRVLEAGAELDAYVPRRGDRGGAAGRQATRSAWSSSPPTTATSSAARISRLVLFEHAGAEWLRDVGSWDPLPPHLSVGYHLGGEKAQVKVWGEGTPSESLLHQIALVSAQGA